MLEIIDILYLIAISGTFFFFLGVFIGPWWVHKATKILGYFIGPKYLIYRGKKTVKKMDKKH